MGNLPKISVIIPAFNSAHYLPEALESVFCQTMNDYEVIVVDDGSTDETSVVLDRYSDRIRCIRQENQGLPGARNTGILQSRGEYIALLDADDLFCPNHLAELSSFLTDYPELGFVFADSEVFSDEGVVTTSCFKSTRIYSIPYRDVGNGRRIFARSILRELAWGSFIPNCTAVIRKEVFERVGLYNIKFRNGQDRDLWLRVDEQYPIGYIDRPLARVRRHSDNISHPKNALRVMGFRREILKGLLTSGRQFNDDDLANIRLALSELNLDLGWEYKQQGAYREADSCYAEALYYKPYNLAAIAQRLHLMWLKGRQKRHA